MSQPLNGPLDPQLTPSGHHWFRSFASRVNQGLGSPAAFIIALVVVSVWALTGPMFHFSNKWLNIIGTFATIVTFLMVFLLQGTQMRDSKALHLKLDELLRAVNQARTGLVGLENLPDEQIAKLANELRDVGEQERGPAREYRQIEDIPRQ